MSLADIDPADAEPSPHAEVPGLAAETETASDGAASTTQDARPATEEVPVEAPAEIPIDGRNVFMLNLTPSLPFSWQTEGVLALMCGRPHPAVVPSSNDPLHAWRPSFCITQPLSTDVHSRCGVAASRWRGG